MRQHLQRYETSVNALVREQQQYEERVAGVFTQALELQRHLTQETAKLAPEGYFATERRRLARELAELQEAEQSAQQSLPKLQQMISTLLGSLADWQQYVQLSVNRQRKGA